MVEDDRRGGELGVELGLVAEHHADAVGAEQIEELILIFESGARSGSWLTRSISRGIIGSRSILSRWSTFERMLLKAVTSTKSSVVGTYQDPQGRLATNPLGQRLLTWKGVG